jgi:hypothetical protein
VAPVAQRRAGASRLLKLAHSADWLGYILGVGAEKGTVHRGTPEAGIFGPPVEARAQRNLRCLTPR